MSEDEILKAAQKEADNKECVPDELFDSLVQMISTYDRTFLRPCLTNPATYAAKSEDL